MSEKKEEKECDLEALWVEFVDVVLTVAESEIGFKLRKKGKRRGVAHWSENLENLKQARCAAWKRDRRCRTSLTKRAYNAARNASRKALKRERLQGWESLCDALERCDQGTRWKKLRSYHRQNGGCMTSLRLRNEEDEMIESESENSNTLNDFYASVAQRMDRGQFDEEWCAKVTEYVGENAHLFCCDAGCDVVESGEVTMSEVEDAIGSMKLSKACGADGIHAEMMRHGGVGLRRALLWLFNLSWSQAYLPLDWRTAQITPVPKVQHACKCSQFRPISLLSVVSKLMESVVAKRLGGAAEAGGWLSDHQGAYRKLRGGTDQLLFLSQRIHDEFEQGRVGVVAFVDISKAYECVWGDGLLYSLMQVGVQGPMLAWIRAFLTGRRGRVRVGGTLSDIKDYERGIPLKDLC